MESFGEPRVICIDSGALHRYGGVIAELSQDILLFGGLEIVVDVIEPHFGGCRVLCRFRLLDEEGNSDAYAHLIVKDVAAFFAALFTGGAGRCL